MNRMPGGKTDGDQTPGGSPVPEWFGRSETTQSTVASGNPLGCVALLFCLAIGGAAIFYGATAEARRTKAANELMQCQRQLSGNASELKQCQQQPKAAAVVPCPPVPAAPAVTEPPAETQPELEPPRAGSLAATDVAEVTRKLNPGFRRCYDQALGENPNAEAKIQLSLTIEPSGKVSDARASGPAGPTGMPPYAYRCIEAIAKGAKFPESTQKTTVNLPITFRSAP
jgi:hypothetical protein